MCQFVVTVEFSETEAQLIELVLAQKGLAHLADRVKSAREELPIPTKEHGHVVITKDCN